MHAWIWPKHIAFALCFLIFTAGILWPFSPEPDQITTSFFWMKQHWGHPIAVSILQGTIQILCWLPHFHFLSEWLDLHVLGHFITQVRILPSLFSICLSFTALAIWLGIECSLIWFCLFCLKFLHSFPLFGNLHRIRSGYQPWKQAQRWPLWRRALGVIPLLTLVWCCSPYLYLAPCIAGIWVCLAYELWWPFWGAKEA